MAKEKSVYDLLKKQNGEAFAKAIRNFDNGILEIPNILYIVKFAGREAESLIPYLRMLKNVHTEEHGVYQDPISLLKKAGYDAFVADTEEKKNSIKHYYALGEEICTFKDPQRHKNYYIIHAVKEGADKLNRKNFKHPERQDKYGTSVISIQILKKGGFISIKNRYNHTVQSCDNTFNSNPDNIIMGLSESIKRFFNVDFNAQRVCLPDGYILLKGCIYKYYKEKDNVYFGDGFYLEDGNVNLVDKNSQLLADHFLIDLKEKKIKDLTHEEGKSYCVLSNAIDGKTLQVKSVKGTKILLADGKEVLRSREGRLVGLTLNDETLEENSFYLNEDLEVLNLPNLKQLKKNTFFSCPNLKEVNMPLCEEVDIYNFKEMAPKVTGDISRLNQKGIVFVGPLLFDIKKGKFITVSNMDHYSFKNVIEKELKNKEIKVEEQGNETKIVADGIEKLTFRDGVVVSLSTEQEYIWDQNIPQTLERLDMLHVEHLTQGSFRSFENLKYLNVPKLKTLSSLCFEDCPLETIHAPCLEEMGEYVFREFQGENVDFPNLRQMGCECLSVTKHDFSMTAPKLASLTTGIGKKTKNIQFDFASLSPDKLRAAIAFCQAGEAFSTPLGMYILNEIKKAEKVTMKCQEFPRAETYYIDGVELCHVFGSSISRVTIRDMKCISLETLSGFKNLESVSLPDTESMFAGNISDCPNLKRLDAPKLKRVGPDFLENTPNLNRVYIPKLKNRLDYVKKHPNFRTLLRYMDEANTPRNKKKFSFIKALFYRDRNIKK